MIGAGTGYLTHRADPDDGDAGDKIEDIGTHGAAAAFIDEGIAHSCRRAAEM